MSMNPEKEEKQFGATPNENLNNVLQNFSNIIILTQPDGTVSYAYGKLLDTLFRKKNNLLQQPIRGIFPEESLANLEKALTEINETKKRSSFLATFVTKDDEFVFDIQIIPTLSSKKEIQFISFYFEDITQWVKEQDFLKQQIDELQFYETIIQKSTDALLVLNDEGKIVFWSEK